MVRALHHHGMFGAMGRVGAAGDNAAMKSFFSLLQKSILTRRSWDTREQLRIAIVTWIERTYHRHRRQKWRCGLTPIEQEAITNTDVALAAWLQAVTYPYGRPSCTRSSCTGSTAAMQ